MSTVLPLPGPGADPSVPQALLVGLDIETGERIFSETLFGIVPSYGIADGLIAVSGLDGEGGFTFVLAKAGGIGPGITATAA